MTEPLHVTPGQAIPERAIAEIDRLVHEPARLAILTVLAACERADFLFLARATGLTRGNLSVQLTRLEEADLIEIEKTIHRNRTLTTAALTRDGRRALDIYWQNMEVLRAHAQDATAKAQKAHPSRSPIRRPASATT
jgi:DNA-binding transcriptional ArsR family regulator